MISKTGTENLFASLSQNTSAENKALGLQLANIETRVLLQKYFNNETSFMQNTVAGQQGYKLPQNYSKMKDVTINVGSIRYTLQEVQTRKEFDVLNFVQWTSDIPAYYFIYDGLVNIFPIPSSNGNTITYNYKLRATDLSISDTSAGTVSVQAGGTTVTGTGTGWNPTVGINETRWIQIPFPNGDGQWYQVASVDSTTSLTLYNAYQGTTNVTNAAYTLGQMSLLMEDFQNIPIYKSLYQYFASIQPNSAKAAEFKLLYDEGIEHMDAYLGSKSTGVALEPTIMPVNPNLYFNA